MSYSFHLLSWIFFSIDLNKLIMIFYPWIDEFNGFMMNSDVNQCEPYVLMLWTICWGILIFKEECHEIEHALLVLHEFILCNIYKYFMGSLRVKYKC